VYKNFYATSAFQEFFVAYSEQIRKLKKNKSGVIRNTHTKFRRGGIYSSSDFWLRWRETCFIIVTGVENDLQYKIINRASVEKLGEYKVHLSMALIKQAP
jgi:hypothetical protein